MGYIVVIDKPGVGQNEGRREGMRTAARKFTRFVIVWVQAGASEISESTTVASFPAYVFQCPWCAHRKEAASTAQVSSYLCWGPSPLDY